MCVTSLLWYCRHVRWANALTAVVLSQWRATAGLMSYSKFVFVLLAINIVYSSVSIPFPTPEPASSQPTVPASSQLHMYLYQPHLSHGHLYQPHQSHGHLYQPHLRHSDTSHSLISATGTSLISAMATCTSLISATMPGPRGFTYENWGVVHFRSIQPVCVCVWGGGGVIRFRPIQPVGGGGMLSTYGSLCLKRERVPSTYMAILKTTLLPVCFKLTLD